MGKLASQSVHTFFTSVFSKFVFGILIDIFISRALGPDGKGQYVLFINTLTGLGLFFGFGIQNSNILKVASKNIEINKSIYFSILVTLIATLLSTVLILLSFKFNFSHLLLPNRKINLNTILLLTSLPLFFLNNFLIGILIGKGEIKFNNYITLFCQGTLSFYFFILFILKILTPSLAISGFIISNILSFILISIRLKLLNELRNNIRNFDSTSLFKYLKDAFPFYLIVIFFFIEMKIDTYFIVSFLGEAQLGIYSTATRMGETIWLISDSISASLLVFLAGSTENKTKITIKVFIFVLFISSTLGLSLLLFGSDFINILYSNRFIDSLTPLHYIIPGVICFSIVRIIGTYLISENRIYTHLLFTFISLSFSISLNYILIPKYLLIGASLSYTIHCTIYAILELSFFLYYTKVTREILRSSIIEIPIDIKRLINTFII